MKKTTYSIGNASESVVLSAYLRAGFTVSIPFGTGAPYDFIVDTGTHLFKIQVKTGRLRNGCILYNSRRRVREASPHAARFYTESEVDYFAIYCPSAGAVFVVPHGKCASEGCLRLDPAINGQQKFIRWARDFTWESHITKLTEFPAATSSTFKL